jgi:cytochrome P450
MLDDKIQPIQEAEVSVLLKDLAENPKDFYHHMQRATASVANIVVWGHRGKTYEDFWGSCVYEAMDQYSASLEPGANPPVDQFPFLKLMPEALSPWKARARKSYKAMDSTWEEARRRVDERRSKGKVRNCIVDRILDGEKALDVPLTDHQLNHFLGVLVEGGADTTASSLLTSILMLALNPHVQKKAQKELDAAVGTER